jgi:hypothetical protein
MAAPDASAFIRVTGDTTQPLVGGLVFRTVTSMQPRGVPAHAAWASGAVEALRGVRRLV